MKDKILWRIYQVAIIAGSFYLLSQSAPPLAQTILSFDFLQWEAYIFLSLLILLSESLYVPGREGDFLTSHFPYALTLLLGAGFPLTIWTVWFISFLVSVISLRRDLLRSLTESSLKVVSLYPVQLFLTAMGGRGESPALVAGQAVACGVIYFASDRIIVGLETALEQGRVFKKNFWLSRLEESYIWYILMLSGATLLAPSYHTPFQMAVFLITGFFLGLFAYFMRSAVINQLNLRAVFEAFSEIAEGRWMGMVGHGKRVGMLVDEITKELDLPFYERQKIILVSIIHDVGIVDTPYEALNHPTEEGEKSEEFKHHVIRGAEIIEAIEQLKPYADYVRYHHERPDGSGYPEGRKGEEIPFWAYVIGACCDFDDMTCYKSYRERIAPREALQMMEKEVGRRYDERAVALLRRAAKRLGRY
ncbi:MAG: HD-GYP domain-containing protein [bacterium]